MAVSSYGPFPIGRKRNLHSVCSFIFYLNFDFWSKLWFSNKARLRTKLDFWATSPFSSIFPKSYFWNAQKSKFWAKIKYLVRGRFFWPNLYFWQKKSLFLTRNLFFVNKNLFLTKNYVFNLNFVFRMDQPIWTTVFYVKTFLLIINYLYW